MRKYTRLVELGPKEKRKDTKTESIMNRKILSCDSRLSRRILKETIAHGYPPPDTMNFRLRAQRPLRYN